MDKNAALFERCQQLYGDDEVARHVADHAIELGTVDKIAEGSLVLPSPADARKYVDRKLGRDNETPSEREAHRKIAELESKIATLTGGK